MLIDAKQIKKSSKPVYLGEHQWPTTYGKWGHYEIGGEKLRCRIDSNSETMQMLHEVYGWVPGAEQVRPTPAVRAQKDASAGRYLSRMARGILGVGGLGA